MVLFMGVSQTVRQRVHDELRSEIIAAASRALAEQGAPALSLRSVARDLGMAPSALYRYVKNRDELLTLLIVHAYENLGAALRQAADSQPGQAGGRGRKSLRERYLAAARQLRTWAFDHPHEWALLYGSPVPGYEAPDLTVPAAIEVHRVFIGLMESAADAGDLRPLPGRPASKKAKKSVAMVEEGLPTTLDRSAIVAALLAASQLFGAVSMELFGHFEGGMSDPGVVYEHLIESVADRVGL